MPHRHADYIDYCCHLDCKKNAYKTCQRCGGTFCKKHAPERDMRCVHCEHSYSLRLAEKGLALPKERTRMEKARNVSFGLMKVGGFSLLAAIFSSVLQVDRLTLFLGILFSIFLFLGVTIWSISLIRFGWERGIDKPFLEPREIAERIRRERILFLEEKYEVFRDEEPQDA